MFRLHKAKSDKSRLRIDFNLSSLQASQVPKGWDKLFVSVISLETGKIIAKSGKTIVKNGKCRWTETLSESLCAAVGDTKQDADQCLIKLVLATGPTKSGVLGEVTVNLVDHISLKASDPLSLPLQKCIYGTILHVKVQCISPRTSQRNENSIDEVSNTGDLNSDFDDMENKSDASDTCFTKSVGSSSGNCFDGSSHLAEIGCRDTAGSRNSFESLDGSLGRGNSSPCCNFSGHTDDTLVPRSGGQSLGQADDFDQLSTIASPHLLNTGSSKDLLDLVDSSNEDFRVQAKKWERNARRLTSELERLRKKFAEQSKNQELLDLDLAASKTACEGLKHENEQLKNILEETKQKSVESSNSHTKNFQKQLEDELRFYKESNAKLSIQLEKTQESNVELVSILQELEETIEKQKEELSSRQDEIQVFKGVELGSPENRQMTSAAGDQIFGKDVDATLSSIEKSGFQSTQIHEPQDKLLKTIHDLERTLEDRKNELEAEKSLQNQSLLDCERKWRSKLVAKDEEIINLEEKLSEAMLAQRSNEKKFVNKEDCYLTEEIQALKNKVQELENDCNELTDENLELIIKLKKAESSLQKSSVFSNSGEGDVSSDNQLNKETEDGNRDILVKLMECQSEDKCKSLEDKCSEMESQLLASKDKISSLEHELLKLKTKAEEKAIELALAHEQLEYFHQNEIANNGRQDNGLGGVFTDDSSCYLDEGLMTSSVVPKDGDIRKQKDAEVPSPFTKPLASCIFDVAEDKRVLEDIKDTRIKETALTSESMDSLDYKSLYGSAESQDSVSEVLQRMSSELESGKHDLELHISELEEENVQLSERISGLEAQLRYLTDEKESSRLDLQLSGSRVTFLQDEIRKLQMEMETERSDMHQKFLDMQQRWSEAQEECEYLKIVNPKLQATTESIIEECSMLQRTSGDLRRQNIQLHEHCAFLQAELQESQKCYSQCIIKIETLEADFSSLIEEISLKSKSFSSEVDALSLENDKLKGKVITEESKLFQEYSEKKAEVENLQREVQWLSEQLSGAHNGDQTFMESAPEISKLHANNAKLEAALLEAQRKIKWFEDKSDALKKAFESKEAELSNMLADSNKRYEVVLADHERVQGLLREAKSSEQKTRSIMYAVDLKLKASEYERLQLVEEIAHLKHQLLKLPELQNEISALKSSLNEAKFANGRLEASFQLVYQDREELKAEKTSLVQKILSMQMLESELEDCRNSKVVLQEKLLRLEGDLTAREAECAEDVKLKHELGRMKRTNSQLQRKIKDFEEDKDEYLKTLTDIEGNQKQKKLRHVASDLGGRFGSRHPRNSTCNSSISEESEFFEVNNGHHFMPKSSLAVGIDSEFPDSEFAEVSISTDMKRTQSVSYTSEIQSSAAVPSKESKEEEFKEKASELEAELKDLHNRYFNMSLKYAEVENEREELLIKLKVVEEGRTWFSYKP
uniref:C2 NT-type domain-containing protein n=1 Tax=Kalanchoe fedtschenkoi TaxID=63787 RepID=A0A7N0RE03_KALFE